LRSKSIRRWAFHVLDLVELNLVAFAAIGLCEVLNKFVCLSKIMLKPCLWNIRRDVQVASSEAIMEHQKPFSSKHETNIVFEEGRES